MNEIQEKWEQTGLLLGLNESKAEEVANCLEAQRIYNETAVEMPDNLKRCSIPIIRRAFSQTQQVFTNSFSEHNYNIHVFKTPWNPPEFSSLKSEANYVAKICESLVEELNTQFKDLPNSKINFGGINVRSDGKLFMHYC